MQADDRDTRREEDLQAWVQDPGNREWLQERFSPIAQRAEQLHRRLTEELVEALKWYGSAEFEEFWRLAKPVIVAHKRGDGAVVAEAVTALYAWAERRGGYGPDGLIGAHLEASKRVRLTLTLKKHLRPVELGAATPGKTFAMVDGRAEGPDGRFIAETRGLAIVKFGAVTAESIPIKGREKTGLAAYALDGQRDREVLKKLLPGMFAELLEGGTPAVELAVEAMRQIGLEYVPPQAQLYDDSESKLLGEFVEYGKRRKAHRDDILELAGFVEVENVLKLGRKAGLTPREFQVFQLVVEEPGITDREIGKRLGIAVGTVKSLRARIRETLGSVRIA